MENARIRELTEQVEALEKENELYRTIIDNLDEGVYAIDENDIIVIYSGKIEQIEGYRRSEMIGKAELVAYQANERGIMYHNRFTERVKKEQKPFFNCIESFYTKGRVPVKVIFNIIPFFYKGEYAGYYSVGTDTNELNPYTLRQKALGANKKDGQASKFGQIIGESDAIKECVDVCQKIAARDVPVMIIGETGTGKELFAREIHENSVKRDGPFVAVNCAAIPDTLLESTLFGTTKGAFTGAVDKSGLFEQAENGTIFLDEINSMPLQAQVKLLRVIQEKTVRRLGSQKEIGINCRIISAANAEISPDSDNFRSDLFFRLAVTGVKLPPLRERGDDILLLTRFFVDRMNRKLSTNITEIDSELKKLLLTYSWPGNVRELQNIIESALNLIGFDETTLRMEHIPEYFRDRMVKTPLNEEPAIAAEVRQVPGLTLRQSMRRFEKQMICATLEKNHWNVSQSARDLGMLRENLRKKIKEYHLKRPDGK